MSLKKSALEALKEPLRKPLQNKPHRRYAPHTIVNITYIIGSYQLAQISLKNSF